jgi:hypothetical protein
MPGNSRTPREGEIYPAPDRPYRPDTPNRRRAPARQTRADPWQAPRDPWDTGGWFGPLTQDPAIAGGEQPHTPPSRGLAYVLSTRRWPIVIILLIQAALSMRLCWSNTDFQDEGLYLSAGYLQLEHHAQLAQIQQLQTWFSGSPAIYPRLGALAAQYGGLAGARLLSLVFMLLATAAVYAVTRRLWYSRVPAAFAAALFGWLGSTQFLGALATFDAMSLALLALATWLGVRAVPCRAPVRYLLLVAAAPLILAANATKYMSLLYAPIVIAVVSLAMWRVRGWASAFASGLVMTAATVLLVLFAYRRSGGYYTAGIKFSTLTRTVGTYSAQQVLAASGRWIGLLVALAFVAATAITWRHRDAATALLAWALAGAALLAPVQEARLHTTVSLYKHVGFGTWFACAAVGWLLANGFEAYERGSIPKLRRLWLGAAIAALAAAIGVVTAGTQYHDWPNSSAATTELTGLVKPHGEYLAEDYDQFTYALRGSVPMSEWWNTWSFSYTDPKTKKHLENNAAYAAAIRYRYFSVIILDFQDTVTTDKAIDQDIKKSHDYRLIATIPFTTSAGPGDYLVWVPTTPKPIAQHRRRRASRGASAPLLESQPYVALGSRPSHHARWLR